MAFIEGKFQPGCYESTKVAFKVVDAATRDSAWDRWQQEVDCDAEVRELPALRREVAVFVVVGREALLAQAATDLGVLLIVEQPNCQPNIEIVGNAAEEVAILLAMSVSEQMPLADVKNRLSEVVDRLQREHGRVVITKHGHPAAVVISVDDLESLEETLDIMDSAALLADIRESLADLSTTDAAVLSKEDALRLISGQ